jgi:hypothetical protein
MMHGEQEHGQNHNPHNDWMEGASMILNKQVEKQGKSLFLGPCRGVVRKCDSILNNGGGCLS